MDHPSKMCVLILLFSSLAFSQTEARISSGVAQGNLVSRVDPVYPQIARAARIQGTVILEVVIDAEGSVATVQAVSGHPMLIGAASDAVKQWRYRPYLLNGAPVSVKTTVTVNFSLDASNTEASEERKEYKDDSSKEEQTSQLYFKQDAQCREAISSSHFSEAELICANQVHTAELLPDSREIERETAYGLAGRAFLSDQKFSEALSYFRRELESAQKHLHDYNVETADAYRHVAWGLFTTGRSDEAVSYFVKAENSFRAAQEAIGSDFLKNEYAKKPKGYSARARHGAARDGEICGS